MADINLLPSEEQVSSQLISLQKKLAFFSVFMLLVVAGFTMFTLYILNSANRQKAEIDNRIGLAESEVRANQLSEELLTVVDKKAGSASKALGARLLYTEVLKKTAEIMPTGVSFANLSIKETVMTANATANSSADVAKLVSYFVSTDEGKKLFSSLNIDSLAKGKDGGYAFSVSMKLNATAAQAPEGGI